MYKSPMLVIFCDDPLNPRALDSCFADEAQAAGEHALVSFEEMATSPARAVRRVPSFETDTLAVYRGWMMKPVVYAAMYDALAARHVRLINDPDAYCHCHHLPNWYGEIYPHTPKSVWMPASPFDTGAIMSALAPFGSRPLIVKDYVKSRKHEWLEACFIPDASDAVAVERVVRRFIELQAEDLNEGLVFREFVDLERIGTHPISGLPLSREHRLFFLDGKCICDFGYWKPADLDPATVAWASTLAAKVRSRFFTMDIARRASGEWVVMELGDGGVSGLPDGASPGALFGPLLSRV